MISNRIYTFLVNKNNITKYSFTLLAFIICCMLWFFLIYTKLSDIQNRLLIDIQEINQKQNLKSNLLDETNNSFEKINKLKNKTQEIFNNDCKLNHIIKLIKSYNLKIISCLEERSNFVNFCIQGKFEQIYNFLEKLSLSNISGELENFTMSQIKEDVLQINILYNFYENQNS